MNILINSYCNLNCPYCFANDTMTKQQVQNMSTENFEIVIEWCKKMNQRTLRLIGGEPTICPNFKKFLNMGVEDPFFTDILIFTNLTFEKDVAIAIADAGRRKPIALLPNINEFNLLIPKHRLNILYNLDFLSQNLSSVNEIGINIYRPDMDLSQWEAIVKKFPNIQVLRYSIAIPNNENINKKFTFYEYYHQFQDILLELGRMGARNKLEILCDCNNLPICCFDDDALREMILLGGYSLLGINFGNGPMGNEYCAFPVIDIRPDLSVASCFGLNPKETVYLTNFENPDDLFDWCHRINDVTNYVPRKECLTCPRYIKNGIACSCRCWHTINKGDIKND